MAVFSLHSFTTKSYQSYNASRRFLVGCSDCRFLVQFSPFVLAFERKGSSFHLSITMILVLSQPRR